MKKIILNLISACILFSILFCPVLVLGVKGGGSSGLGVKGGVNNDLEGPLENIDVMRLLRTILNIIFTIFLTVAAIFIIIAGFYFVTAQGDPEQIKKARNMVLYALIGVVVAVISRGIVTWLQTTIQSTQ